MNWKVEFYRGVDDSILYDWPVGMRAKFFWIVEKLRQHGPENVGMPHVEAFGQGLFEIRAKGKEGIGRAFFCILQEKRLFVVSAFIKKTQKTPKNEIDVAIKRMKVIKSYE